MRAIFARNVALAGRSTALPAAVMAHAAAMAAFVLVWGPTGVPALGGVNVFEQLGTIQWALLTVLLPWAAARLTAERGDGLVHLSALTALPPSRVVAATLVSAWAMLALVVAAALPVVILAQRMSAVPISFAVRQQTPLFALAAFVSAVTAVWMRFHVSRIAAWVGAAATTVLTVALAPGSLGAPGLTAAMTGAAMAVAAALVTSSDTRLRHLSERRS
jgi:hypothetical protein